MSEPSASVESPWLGLEPFKEEDRKFFFGRNREVEELFAALRHQQLTVLFGRSGNGKTSLLRAGLVPVLRENHLLPIVIRLDFLPTGKIEGEVDLVAQTMTAVSRALGEAGHPSLQTGTAGRASLWEWAHDSASGLGIQNATNVILIFDQFEELFTLGRDFPKQVQAFMEALAALVENAPPTDFRHRLETDRSLLDRYDFDTNRCRVLIAIRADFLSEFERFRKLIPSLAKGRYQIDLLSGPQALEAVYRPGTLRSGDHPIIPLEIAEHIVRRVARANEEIPLEDLRAVPPLVSLFCSGINAKRLQTAGGGGTQVTAELVQACGDQILPDFYASAFVDVPSPAVVRAMVENFLVTESGFRQSLPLPDAIGTLQKLGLDQGDAERALNTLENHRLLAVEAHEGSRRVELIHDLLLNEVKKSRSERTRREAEKFGAMQQLRIAKAEGFLTFLLTRVHKELQAAGSRKLIQELFQQLQDHYSELSNDEKKAPEALRNRATLFYEMGLARSEEGDFENATLALQQSKELWRLLPPFEVASDLELTSQALARAEQRLREAGIDIYVSYSRRDNERGQVTALKTHIEFSFRAFAGRELRMFFDMHEISGMDDWQQRSQRSLRDSKVFLAVLSPNYIASPYCRWEWENYVRYEPMRQLVGEGIVPVFFVTLPDVGDPKTDQALARWIDEIQCRQTFDLRPWHDAGEQALQQPYVRQTLEQLHAFVRERLDRAERSRRSPNNLIKHNPAFVGRATELTALRHALTKNKLGVVGTREGQVPSRASVQGLGGIGKTELALAYAHAFAWDYPGGRWQIPCEHLSDLRVALLHLANAKALSFEFTEDEKKDTALAFERVLRELNRRERCLLILDNVSDPNLLQPEYLDRLPRDGRVDVITTTRLAPRAIPGSAQEQTFIAVDELPEEDALELMRSHQPEGRFASQQEDNEARAIVRLLRGLTLAVETAAIYLGHDTAPDACRRFRERLSSDLLRESEAAATDPAVAVRHRVRSLEETLAFTLQTLTPESLHMLRIASLLPADQIALPWLKAVGAEQFPSFDAEPLSATSAYRKAEDLLLSLHLFQSGDVKDDDGQLLAARMHRLLQQLILQREGFEKEQVLEKLVGHAASRCKFLEQGWLDWKNRWEVEPLRAFAEQLLALNHPRASYVALSVSQRLHDLARYDEAESLMRGALAIDERNWGSDHPNVSRDLNCLAAILQSTDRVVEAEPLLRRALDIDEKSFGPEHPEVAIRFNNLAQLLQATNRLGEAESLLRRALAINQQNFGSDHPDVAATLNNLASLLQSTDRLAEAEPLMRQALAISEQSFGSNHPSVARGLNNLALVLQSTNQLVKAEPLLRRALAIDEQSFGPNHPNVATDLNNLAALLQATNRLTEAEPLLRRALTIDERSFGPAHPNVARDRNRLAALQRVLQDRTREKVFVCYSRQDASYAEELRLHLHGLGSDTVLFWTDDHLRAGDEWKLEIEQALRECTAAIILVSANLMNSRFIQEIEFPALLNASVVRGTRLFPVLIDQINLNAAIGDPRFRFQFPAGSISSPLQNRPRSERERVWASVSQQVTRAIGAFQSS